MTVDEWLKLPCEICSYHRNYHIGRAFDCPGGLGTVWRPQDFQIEKEPGKVPLDIPITTPHQAEWFIQALMKAMWTVLVMEPHNRNNIVSRTQHNSRAEAAEVVGSYRNARWIHRDRSTNTYIVHVSK